MDQRLQRRSLLGGTLGFAGLIALGGRDLRLGPATAAARSQDAALPDDAAPADQQVYVVPNDTKPIRRLTSTSQFTSGFPTVPPISFPIPWSGSTAISRSSRPPH